MDNINEHILGDEFKSDIKDAFLLYDRDFDGILTGNEIDELVRDFGIQEYNIIGLESLTFEDFWKIIDNMVNGDITEEERISIPFMFTSYKDGMIDTSEFINKIDLERDDLEEILRDHGKDDKIPIVTLLT